MRPRSVPAPYLVLLAVLLAVTTALVLGDWMFRRDTPGFADPNWDMTLDGGWAEMARGGQLVFAAALLCVLALLYRQAPVLYAWAAILVLIAADDMGGIHERLGAGIAEALGLSPVAGLRTEDLGELAIYAVIFIAVAVSVVATHRRSSAPARRASWRIGVIAGLTGLLIVVIDMGTIAVSDLVEPRVYYLLNMIELWAESAAAGVLLVSVLLMVTRGLPAPGHGRFGWLGALPQARVRLDDAAPAVEVPVSVPTG